MSKETSAPNRNLTWTLCLSALAILAIAAGYAFQQFVIPRILSGAVESRITPTLIQTLQLRAWMAYGCGIALAFFAVLSLRFPLWKVSAGTWLTMAVSLAAVLRFATPEMAFNSIVRPDGVHFSVAAQRLVTHGELTVPTGGAILPARTLPGESFIQALTQWTNPEHPGQGIFAVWFLSVITLLIAARIARQLGNRAAMWWALGLIAFSPLHAWYSRQLMSEIPWGLTVLVSCGMIAAGTGKPLRLFAAGVLTGLGLAFKSSHLLIVLATVVGAGMALPGRPRLSWKMTGALVLGMCIGVLPAFYYNYSVLGGWLRTAYHVYWPGWASATEAMNIRYLWAPPLIKGTMGNVPYYIYSSLGLDLRPEKMLLLPGLLVIIIWLVFRRPRVPLPALPGRVIFMRMTWWITLVYGIGCLLYSFQDPRFLLPVIPLLFTALALRLAGAVNWKTLQSHRLVSFSCLTLVGGLLGLGIGVVRVEAFGNRTPERLILNTLAQAAVSYDVIVSDEDPVLLTIFSVWSKNTRIYPLLLKDELWFPENPAEYFAEHHVAVKPFEGTVDRINQALDAGQRVAVFVRRAQDRPAAWKAFNDAFELTPASDPVLPWLKTVSRRSPETTTSTTTTESVTEHPGLEDTSEPGSEAKAVTAPMDHPAGFMRGQHMDGDVVAPERSLPVQPVQLSPFTLAHTEVNNASYVEFLSSELKNETLGVETQENEVTVIWPVTNSIRYTVCRISPQEVNCGLEYDVTDRIFRVRGDGRTSMGDYPVVLVSWYGAALYANWLSRKDGLPEVYGITDDGSITSRLDRSGWRLPTESEWEYTATWDGTSKRIYAWGNDWNPDFANLAESPRNPRPDDTPLTVPVDKAAPWTKNSPSPTRHLHLTGNVWEWCQDWLEEYTSQAVTDPTGAPTGTLRVVRGGSYRTHQESAWSAFRGIATPDTMTPDIGFRVARPVN